MAGRQRNLEVRAIDPDPQATFAAAVANGARDRGILRQRDTYFHAVRGRLKLRAAPPTPPERISGARAELAGPNVSHDRVVPVGYADPRARRGRAA